MLIFVEEKSTHNSSRQNNWIDDGEWYDENDNLKDQKAKKGHADDCDIQLST